MNQIEIIISDFRRTKETAEVLAEKLGNAIPVRLSEGLRERFLGELEGREHVELAELVEREGMEAVIRRYGCETAESVYSRVVRVIRDLEGEHEGKTLILVSHADPIQFLMAASAGLDVGERERIVPLDCSEIAERSLGMSVLFSGGEAA